MTTYYYSTISGHDTPMHYNLNEIRERFPEIDIEEHWLTNKGEEEELIGYRFRLNNFIYFYDIDGNFLYERAL